MSTVITWGIHWDGDLDSKLSAGSKYSQTQLLTTDVLVYTLNLHCSEVPNNAFLDQRKQPSFTFLISLISMTSLKKTSPEYSHTLQTIYYQKASGVFG